MNHRLSVASCLIQQFVILSCCAVLFTMPANAQNDTTKPPAGDPTPTTSTTGKSAPIRIDGDWNIPGAIITIDGGIGNVSAVFKEIGNNSYNVAAGTPCLLGEYDGQSFNGTIILRGKDQQDQVYELPTTLTLELSTDANSLTGQYENRRFSMTKKKWLDESRSDSIILTRVNPIDPQTLEKLKQGIDPNATGNENQNDPATMDDIAKDEKNGSSGIVITSIVSVEPLDYQKLQTTPATERDPAVLGTIWLRITGENLPVADENLAITIDDPDITYTGQHKPDPTDKKALQIEVKLAQAAQPGPKGITLSEAPGTWDYDFSDLTPKSIEFVRQVYVDVFNPAEQAYLGEMLFVRVKFPKIVRFKSRKLDLYADKKKLMELEIVPVPGNNLIFQSKALLLPGNPAAMAILGDSKGSGVEQPDDAIKLEGVSGNQTLVAIFQGMVSTVNGKQEVKPYARCYVNMLPSNEWITAMQKAEQCWENSTSSAKSKFPRGYEFTNEIIFTTRRKAGEWFSNTRSLHMTIRDHAACLLIRNEAAAQLRRKIQEYNSGDGVPEPVGRTQKDQDQYRAAVKVRTDIKRQYAANMSLAAGRGLGHPLFFAKVTGPKGGEMPLNKAISPAQLQSAFGDARSVNALNYAVVAIDQAQGVMHGNMSYSLDRLTNLDDCDYEGLLRVCGFGFGAIGSLVKDRLLIPANDGTNRLVPDRAGYVSMDRVNTLYQALRAEEAYARSDTELAVFVATAPFLYLSVAATAGTTAASIAAGGVIAGELADLGLMAADAYEYHRLNGEETDFRTGLIEVAGTEGLRDVQTEANERYWKAVLSGGAALGGTALGELGGALVKRFGKSGFDALESAVEKAAAKGTQSLSKAEKELMEKAGLFKYLGDQPSPELANNLIQGIRQAKEAAEQAAKQADTTVASATPTKTSASDDLVDTLKTPSPARDVDDLTGTLKTPSPAKDVEDLTGTLKTPSPAKDIDDLTGTLKTPSPAKDIDDLTGTLKTPSPAKDIDDLTGTLKTPSPAKDIDALTGTLKTPSPAKDVDDLTGTLKTPSPAKDVDDLTGTLKTPSPAKDIEDLTGTLKTPSPAKDVDDLTGTLKTPSPTKDIDDLTGTLKTPSPAKDIDDLTGTLKTPSPAKDVDDLTGTLKTPSPAKDVDDLTGTVKPNRVPRDGEDLTGTLGGRKLPDDAVPTPAPAPGPSVRAADVDIRTVGKPDIQPPAPPAPGSAFRTADGQVIQLGNQIGTGTFSDVFAIAGDESRVIKFVKRSEDSAGQGLNAWQLALEGKQASELLDASGIPQLKVLDADFMGEQPYMIVEKINRNMQILDYDQLTTKTRDALIQSGKWSNEHEQAVVKLLKDMADRNLIWEDCHLGNVFFQRDAAGKLYAGVLDHGRIGKWGDLNFNMQEWVKSLQQIGYKNNQFFSGNIFSNVGTGGAFKFSSPQEFMAKMLEHKRWIEWDTATGKFKGLKLDPANIDRNLFPIENWVAPTAKPTSTLPLPLHIQWPWRQVFKQAA